MNFLKRKRTLQYQDTLVKEYPDEFKSIKDGETVLARTVTFQVTDECNLACKYCYQINKSTRKMSFETAKKYVDMILDGCEYINPEISPAIIIEFIGGEPFLEIELITKICDYIEQELIIRDHPWLHRHIYSICSNGVLYFDERVQEFLHRYRHMLSFSITIDGNKELHDSCRVFHNGKGSYDIAMAGAEDWISRGNHMGSKLTIAPGNINYLYDAVIHMINKGYSEINANCVYEKGWNNQHAKEFYYQMKKIADYFYDNDLETSHYLSLFEDGMFCPKKEGDDTNWCGGTGVMLSCDPDGYLYPCIRYMESSLGNEIKPLRIGHVDTGIATKCEEKECIKCLSAITRRSQSTDECYYCPIAEGCSWCSAYNYQEFGTVDHRATYICEMHKARSLANVYFWNRLYKKLGLRDRFIMYLPKDEALKIVTEKEYEMLEQLSN